MAQRPAPEINTTPLIDVLLVLLVLLVLTLPRSTHRIALDLPAGPAAQKPIPQVRIEVDFDGRVVWDDTPVPDDERLEAWLRQAAGASSVVRIFPDRRVRYERVAQILAFAQRAHVAHLALASVAD
ncbi:MAG TPA: biopolymer transporter ExbD [Steroidobacteraceae bacterium]|nr:biopolymer transporter ExbD [Steroidobacteraceae bacterium]